MKAIKYETLFLLIVIHFYTCVLASLMSPLLSFRFSLFSSRLIYNESFKYEQRRKLWKRNDNNHFLHFPIASWHFNDRPHLWQTFWRNCQFHTIFVLMQIKYFTQRQCCIYAIMNSIIVLKHSVVCSLHFLNWILNDFHKEKQ